MDPKKFADFLLAETAILQPKICLQVETLSVFLNWYGNKKTEISEGVEKNTLEKLGELTTDYLASQIELIPIEGETVHEQNDFRVRATVKLLIELRLEIALLRTNFFLETIMPIYRRGTNPSVAWSVYEECSTKLSLEQSYKLGTEAWTKHALSIWAGGKDKKAPDFEELKQAAYLRLSESSRQRVPLVWGAD